MTSKPNEKPKDKQERSSISGQLCIAFVFFLVGLLLIDLIPLQEPMMCANYTNATLCPDLVFSQSYFDARAKFRKAAAEAGAELSQHVVLEEDGIAYTQDVAYLRSPAADAANDRLLVHLSGTHGVEGFVGSAIQTKLLQEWSTTYANTSNKSRAYPSVLFVHAVNPYGFAHMRRFNEHNVDLNRNCFDDEAGLQEVLNRDPNIAHFDDFKEDLSPQYVPSLIDRYVVLLRMGWHVAKNGMKKMKTALVTGQYHEPQALYFGGRSEQKSIQVMKSIVKKYTAGVKRAVVVDVHSGLGPEGLDTLMVDTDGDASFLRQYVGKEFTVEPTSVESGPNSGYDLARGGMNLRPLFEGKLDFLLHFTEEFGTVAPLFVARALILENNAYHLARGTYIHEMTKDWLRDAFYPQRMSFKTSVLNRGTKLFAHMWDALE